MGRTLILLFWFFAASASHATACERGTVPFEPKVFLGLYDGQREGAPDETRLHKFIEFPLNFLGYTLRYIDVSTARLPDTDDPELAGAISWFDGPVDDAHQFSAWAVASRSKCPDSFGFLVFGETGLLPNKEPDAVEEAYLRRLGLRWTSKSVLLGDFTEVKHVDNALLGFESDFAFRPGRFASLQSISPGDSKLRIVPVGKPIEASLDLVVLRRPNAYVQGSAAIDADGRAGAQFWIVDPFEIIRRSLPDAPRPIADVTTLNGRRIYFETVGPEGWLTPAPARTFDEVPRLASQNLFDHLIAPFLDVPTTISVVTGDLDPEIGGKLADTGRRAAEQIFALPQTAIATSGRSLVRSWGAIAEKLDPPPVTSTAPIPAMTPDKSSQLLTFLGRNLREAFADPEGPAEPQLSDGLRQYGQDPLILEDETTVALRAVGALAPGKEASPFFLWSGDGKPPERALELVSGVGSPALGGGQTALGEIHSIAGLSPFARQAGQSLQVYHALPGDLADLGYPSDDAHGLHGLALLVQQTNQPIRLKPFQLAYSAGSANQFGTRSAIERLKQMASSSNTIPIFAARYVEMVHGFSSVQFIPAGPNRWRVSGRGSLQTIRFDNSRSYALDLFESRGVLGARRINGSLYVALNPEIAEPVVALISDNSARGMALPDGMIGVSESNLEFVSAKISACEAVVVATGWGEGVLGFFGDADARYRIQVKGGAHESTGSVLDEIEAVADGVGYVSIRVPTLHGKIQTITVRQQCPN